MNDLNKKFSDTERAIQRYVVGRMADSEAEDFEAYFLSKPELIEQVEIAQSMHIGLINQSQISVSTAQSKSTQLNSRATVLDTVIGWLKIPVPAFAVLAIAAVLSPMALNGLSSIGADHSIELVGFSTSTTRSATQKPNIDLTQLQGQAALMVKIKDVTHPNYKLRLTTESTGEPAWTSNEFQLSALRDYLVLIPKELVGRKYEVSVVGVGGDLLESPVEFCHYSEVCN